MNKIPERPTSLDWWFEQQKKEIEEYDKKLKRELIIVLGGVCVLAVAYLALVVVLS